MIVVIRLASTALLAALAVAPAAHAAEQGSRSQGTDLQAMMNQCDQMRQQMRPGAAVPADMRQMMTQCDQMDRRMGTMPGMGAQAPAGTRSR